MHHNGRTTYGVGRRVGAAGNVLLATLVDQVLDGDSDDDGDLDIQLGALVEDTETIGAGATSDQVSEEATTETGVDVGGVTGVDGLVAARELSLVTTLGLGLLDGHALGDGEANTTVLLGLEGLGGHGSGHGGEGKSNGGQRELHFEYGELKSVVFKKVDRVFGVSKK
jgi:hypothetical protein